jgi:uncharacterized protein
LSGLRKLHRMKARGHDPLRLDVAAAAADAAALAGRWPLASLSRLQATGGGELEVDWAARFERRTVAGGPPQVWLHLQARACVARECQRCLQPVLLPLSVDRALRFVPTEEQAAALDAESEDDVLAMPQRLDLRELVEDELLLALPLVPKHEDCPMPDAAAARSPGAAADHPFAALAAWKRGGGH